MMKGWKDMPVGGLILDAGNSIEYKTGSWRAKRPIIDKEKCINCLICWYLCPDFAIIVENEKIISTDYDYCKGCGTCANECPKKCINMVDEK